MVEYARDTWVHMGCPRQPQLLCLSDLQLWYDANEPSDGFLATPHALWAIRRSWASRRPFLHVLPALPDKSQLGFNAWCFSWSMNWH